MAHNADNSFLLDRLIKASIKNQSDANIERLQRTASRTLANSRSARINQFEVTARLEGLEEKWRILNNDPLAEALHLRRTELSARSNKWTPEILSLLLHLSDRPVDHSNAVDLAQSKTEVPSVPLTWADIVAGDPLDDRDGIWKNVDFTANDSDDGEWTESLQFDDSVPIPESSVVGQAVEACIETLIEPIPLRKIQNAQSWNMQDADKLDLIRWEDENRRPKMTLTELQAGREVLFLLLGLPTSVLSQNNQEQISVSEADFLGHASQESLTTLLQRFAVIANKLLSIRQWIGKDERIPLEQTLQAALASRLGVVDHALSAIQRKILSRDARSFPSLLELYDEASNLTRLLLQVHDILLELDVNSKLERPFRILECLFDRTCLNQGIGDAEGYEYMANLFFDCFQTYLRPIRLWMEKGQLTGRDGVIFIKENEKDVPLRCLWRDQYHLIRDGNGGLHAPKFLHVAAKKIFNTGKSVDFLRRLGWEDRELKRDLAKEVAMTYESVCQSAALGLFSPFAELFDLALSTWIANKHRASMSQLRAQLESRCGLQSSLDALEYIYFTNGALSTTVNSRIFERINRGNHRWNDGFIMTELFHGALNSVPCIDIGRLEVCLSPATQLESSVARRSMSVLEEIRVSYTLPWSVANVIRTNSIELYQRVFVFLTQMQRAKYLLQRQKMPKCMQATGKEPCLQLYTLRHRLLWLTNTILTYTTDMVLSVATADMRIAMGQAEDVDSMIAVHQAYIIRLEDQCLLLKRHTSVRQAIMSLLDLTILFSDLQACYATNHMSTDSDRGFKGTKGSQEHASNSEQGEVAKVASDDEDSDSDSHDSSPRSALHAELLDADKLKQMLDTFRRLHTFVTAGVRGISKADSAPSWEMLANNLAMGLEK